MEKPPDMIIFLGKPWNCGVIVPPSCPTHRWKDLHSTAPPPRNTTSLAFPRGWMDSLLGNHQNWTLKTIKNSGLTIKNVDSTSRNCDPTMRNCDFTIQNLYVIPPKRSFNHWVVNIKLEYLFGLVSYQRVYLSIHIIVDTGYHGT
jgi:hypothetical protein